MTVRIFLTRFIYITSRKEVGINDYISYEFKDIERKIQDLNFIKEIAETLYGMVESFEI